MLRSIMLPVVLAMLAADGVGGGSKAKPTEDAILKKFGLPQNLKEQGTGGSSSIKVDPVVFMAFMSKGGNTTTGNFLKSIGIEEPNARTRGKVRDLVSDIQRAIKGGKFLESFPSFVVIRTGEQTVQGIKGVSLEEAAHLIDKQYVVKEKVRS